MYGRMQEDVAWTRLLDQQRELENARLTGGAPTLRRVLAILVERLWLLAGLAAHRAPRRSAPAPVMGRRAALRR